MSSADFSEMSVVDLRKYAKEHAKLEVPESVAVLDFSKYGIDLLADAVAACPA